MERRRLVGRRYEDYLKNNIIINLTAIEHAWRMILLDPRYNTLVERRKTVKRKSDIILFTPLNIFQPECSIMLLQHFNE